MAACAGQRGELLPSQCTTVNGVEVDISISGPGGVLAARFMAKEARAWGWIMTRDHISLMFISLTSIQSQLLYML